MNIYYAIKFTMNLFKLVVGLFKIIWNGLICFYQLVLNFDYKFLL